MQCVYDMYGAGTKLITMALQLGKIVDKVRMYGLLVAMKDTSAAYILKLDMNFLHGLCNFTKSCQKYEFIEGINVILHQLKSTTS